MRNFLKGRRLKVLLPYEDIRMLEESYARVSVGWEPLVSEAVTTIFLLGRLASYSKPVFTFLTKEDHISSLVNEYTEEYDIVRVVVDNVDFPVYSLEEYNETVFDYGYQAKHANRESEQQLN
jgi:hypothetical protein